MWLRGPGQPRVSDPRREKIDRGILVLGGLYMPSKNLRTLNNGWPFGEAPMACPFRFDIRDGRIFLMCRSDCEQAIWTATDPEDLIGYTIDLAVLKARIVDHWLKVHAEEIAAETAC